MSNRPIKTFNAGNIEVAVWENRNDELKVFHTITAKRSYMDDDGEWKDTGTISLLPLHAYDLIAALQQSVAHVRIDLRQARRQQNASEEETRAGKETATPAEQAELTENGGGKTFAGKESRRRGDSAKTR